MIAILLAGLRRPTAPHARPFLVVALSLVATVCVHAQTNVLWNFGTTAALATPSSGLPADVTGGGVTQGNNNGTTPLLTTVSVSSGYAGATGQFNAGAAARIGALNPATSAYFQVVLTPGAGRQLTISGLQFGSRSTGTGPQAYAVYSSMDAFAAPVASGTFLNNSTWILHTPAFASVTGPTGTPVTLRLFGFNGAGGAQANTANWRIDDLRLTLSTTAGPAPAPAVTNTAPADGATLVPVNTAISVTFNQPVTVQSGAFAISGSGSGLHSATVSGGPTTFTLTPFSPFLNGETVTVTAFAAQIADQATGLVNPASDYTFSFTTVPPTPFRLIHQVQGSGAASPLTGQDVTVRGVVTATFSGTGGLRGFFVQEEEADYDSDSTTSEGIFVFDASGSAPVSIGALVAVTGRVTEFNGLTQLGTPVSVSVQGTAPLPAATPLSLPVPAPTALETLEGMRVSLPQTLSVTDTFSLGQFGEVVVSSGGILPNPTNVAAPGAPALAQAAANRLNRLVIDDGRSPAYPDPTPYLFGTTAEASTLRIGDTVTGVEGVLTFQFDDYTVQPTTPPAFVRAHPRTLPEPPRRSLRIASANVLNFFNGNGTGGGFPTSRGADTPAEFARQRAHIVTSLLATQADIIGLIEIENDGFGPASAIRDLAAALNAAQPASLAYAVLDLGGPVGTDAITCGFLYRPSRVKLAGSPAVNLAPVFDRPPVAQTFTAANGEKFTVCVNHFKSKGSAPSGGPDADQGDGQGAWNVRRTQQAAALTAWLATSPTGTTDPDTLIIGDLNAYAKEDPITTILNAGYVNILETLEGPGGYSYVFNGEAGHLDHALGTNSLWRQVVSAFTWHNNAAEPPYLDYNLENKTPAQQAVNNGPANNGATPWRASDHDPVIIDIKPGAPVR
jgi:hypothetical protein